MINSISGGEGTKNSTYYRKLLRGITIGGRSHQRKKQQGKHPAIRSSIQH